MTEIRDRRACGLSPFTSIEVDTGSALREHNLWYGRAERLRVPFVFVELRRDRRRADVVYDMWTTDYDLTVEACERINLLMQECAQKMFRLRRVRKPIYFSAGDNGSIGPLPLAEAQELAQGIVEELLQPDAVVPIRQKLLEWAAEG